jgi:transposase
VKAYVKRNKNDAADAEAICEAVRRPTMRFVQIKSAEQQGQFMQHRTRDLLMRQRTQLINALRAHLAELGIVAAKGDSGVKELLAIDLAAGTGLSGSTIMRMVKGQSARRGRKFRDLEYPCSLRSRYASSMPASTTV